MSERSEKMLEAMAHEQITAALTPEQMRYEMAEFAENSDFDNMYDTMYTDKTDDELVKLFTGFLKAYA